MRRKGGSTTRTRRIVHPRMPLVRRARGRGAVFSIEMMMFITILIPMMFALTEFSLLWSARHTLQAAAFEAARAASMPCPDDSTRRLCAEAAADAVISNKRLREGYDFEEFDVGTVTGTEVRVKLKAPMTKASPDLLGIIGISIKENFLTAEAVTRRQ